MAKLLPAAAESIATHTAGNPPVLSPATSDALAGVLHAACAPLDSGHYKQHVDADIRHAESNADYHADETHRSCSRVKTLLDSPALYYQRHVAKTLPPYQSSALDHGTLVHRWLEEGDPFLETLVSPPASTLTATGQVGKDAEKWAKNEAPAGSTVVAPKERAQIFAEVASIKANPAAAELIAEITAHEVSIRWTSADGHRLKCRADAVTPHCWIDLKTTRDADILVEWWRSCLQFRYHLQCAWYMRGMEACGLTPTPLRFIVISTSLPHDCQVVVLPEAVITEGQRLMDKALADLRLREDLDWWLPDQHGEVVELQFPAHALRSMS